MCNIFRTKLIQIHSGGGVTHKKSFSQHVSLLFFIRAALNFKRKIRQRKKNLFARCPQLRTYLLEPFCPNLTSLFLQKNHIDQQGYCIYKLLFNRKYLANKFSFSEGENNRFHKENKLDQCCTSVQFGVDIVSFS